MIKRIDLIYIALLLLIALVATGLLPRTIILYVTILLAIYFVFVSPEETSLFFIRSIPLFIAIPISTGFDSLNMWRILSIILFLKWLWKINIKEITQFSENKKVFFILSLLLALSVLSVFQAQDPILAIKRIIYFLNAGLIGIVLYDLSSKVLNFKQNIIKNIAIPVILVTIIGFIQLASTYVLSIEQFFGFWGDIIERNLFGNAWADIALKANTWFSYFGDQISLRMFSIFPDSHSFPIFLILGIPAIMAISLGKIASLKIGLKRMYGVRGRLLIVFVPLAFLGVILSGTRGMWLAGGLSFVLFLAVSFALNWYKLNKNKATIYRYVGSYILSFFLLFSIAYPIMASPQFQMYKFGGGMMGNRIKSIINLGETSNSRRIQIWKDSLKSIADHPFLGVGIHNFPIVVGEDLAKTKAGSSAHNLYLHIAAELGIPALILALYFLWLLIKNAYNNLVVEDDPFLSVYFAASVIFIPWNLMYSFTDIAIFDERALLFFVATISIIFSKKLKKVTS